MRRVVLSCGREISEEMVIEGILWWKGKLEQVEVGDGNGSCPGWMIESTLINPVGRTVGPIGERSLTSPHPKPFCGRIVVVGCIGSRATMQSTQRTFERPKLKCMTSLVG